jgi:tetratricopeptide (TPR) repeat protein
VRTTALCSTLIFCVSLSAQASSPAEISIRKAEQDITRQPEHYPYYNALAMAYARRARETSDVAFYGQAEEALKRSFALSPDNYEGLKVKTWLLLGRHEFAKALAVAKDLNRRMPDDVTVYGYLADANAELGNYADAVSAVQWMLDLRPGNVAGLTRAAYQRELHGDIPGALELMQMAYDATPYQEFEDRGWLFTQMAHLHLIAGDLDRAETSARGALELFPDYHYALGTLGQIRMAQHRYAEAAEFFEKRYAAAPHAENLFSVGEALEHAGRDAEALAAFAEFERKALAESALADNANHELIAYYTDYANQPATALRLAEQELARRHDIFTIDAHAWSLAASGDYAQANSEIQRALAVGVKDPKLLDHARLIAAHAASQPLTRASR